MSRCMGFDFGLETKEYSSCLKRTDRWLFKIPQISADKIESLPPLKSARPSISFKTMEIQHLNEIIYRPSKPDWKTVSLVLYDLKRKTHPVFDWLQRQYDPSNGDWYSGGRAPNSALVSTFIVDQALLDLYDGCGNILETWVYENVWPETIDFGDLFMEDASFITCDLTLRYDRAYLEDHKHRTKLPKAYDYPNQVTGSL